MAGDESYKLNLTKQSLLVSHIYLLSPNLPPLEAQTPFPLSCNAYDLSLFVKMESFFFS